VTICSRLVELRSKLWRRWLWFRFRHEIADSVCRSQQAIQRGDVDDFVAELCRQVESFQWPFLLDEQLFCRDRRPKDPEQSMALLLKLHHCSHLSAYQHFYAGVAAVYTALAHNLVSDLGITQVWLQDQASLNGFIDEHLVARSRNRENIYKQVVSARACLLQLSLLQGASGGPLIGMIGKSNLALIRVLDFRKISPDALYRSTSNLLRGLLPLSFEWEALASLLPELRRLRDELSCLRYQRVRRLAKEDHLQRLNDVIDLLQDAQLHDDPELRDQRLLLMLNQPTSMLTAAARRWLHSLPDLR
jgi:hypothetical protein